jgi:sacsin
MKIGWEQSVPKEVLFQQLDICLKDLNYERVNSLLSNMWSDYTHGLRSKPCILGSHGGYFLPDKVFLTGSRLTLHPLAPYLDEVDGGFAKKHTDMLKTLDVRSEPSVGDLQYVQRALQASEDGQLSDKNLNIAIATLEVATLLGYGPSNFSIPDRMSILRSLPDIVHGDPNVNGSIANFNFTHARVSEDLITRLGIENCFARATRLAIDFEDEDEDEYVPREKLSNIIKDTLGRYPIEATFNEFLANADDARATKVSWMIDECNTGPYESQNLLTNELAISQGPALMVYNDGVFSAKDFDGFKEIGQGGKTDDATTTGMFGRGVMSMYHFTDVPMIISGGFYVVLDPQQECLPRNRHWKRKVGVKIALSTIRRVAEGQLLPFHGVYGYDKSQDHYDGTIFRFPFRESERQTKLNESWRHYSPSTTRSLLEDYFRTARISLLFLTNVAHVDFCIRGQAEPRWCVSAHRSEDSEDEVFRQVKITNAKVNHGLMNDIWRVGRTDIERSPPEIVKIGKGSSKVTECGIAACLQQGIFDSIPSNRANDHEVVLQHVGEERRWRVDQRVFCKLPTSSESRLPVSFHASFAITGDRKTIAFEDQSELAVWNDWLLTKCLPSFYLDFLKDLSPRLGQQAFDFWPSRSVTAQSTTLSSTVAKAFWDQLLDPEHIAYQLYPTLDQDKIVLTHGANDLRRPKQRKARKLHPVTSFTNAKFDFLPPDVSEKLQPLFRELLTDLVRPPDRIWRSLKNASKDLPIVQLDSDRLAELFHHEASCTHLESFLSHLHREVDKKKIMEALLDVLIPLPLGDDLTPLKKLHGCRVMPRPSLDAPLGLLTWEPKPDARSNLIATREEQKLFGFASEFMVNTEIFSSSAINLERDNWPVRRNPVMELIETPLNVRKLEIDDLGSLLAHPDSPSALKISSDLRDRWMPMLWEDTNIKFKALRVKAGTSFGSPPLTVDSLLSKARILDQPVYRYRANEQWQYLTPREFGTEACIVGPDPKDQQDLCAMIPGLKCLDPNCLPSLLVEPESDLSKAASFQRFLQALRTNGKQQGVAIKTILKEALSAEAKETLRKLVAKYTEESPAPKLVADNVILQTLPIWPCFQRSDLSHVPQHVAAEDSWFCKHSTMFMPWAKDLERFVDPGVVKVEEEWLVKLRVPLMSAETFWQRINKDLPQQIVSTFEVEQFLILIKYLAISNIILSGYVAPNGAGQLCQANSLYNHDHSVFQAAFRGEESVRFLHPDFQHLKHHWLRAGLRSPPPSGLIGKDDYVQCALAIDRQWPPNVPNEPFNRSAKTVSAYLQYDSPDFINWPAACWNQISRVRMFEVKGSQDDQPEYRKDRMREIAQEHSHCALKDTVTIAHLRVSWSQIRYLRNPPAAGVFEKLPGAGSPPIAMVFKHLQFLTGLCKDVSQYDLQEYLKDVQACYDRLQNDPSSKDIPSINEARIFFNMKTTQIDVVHKPDVESSLTTAKLLCLNSRSKATCPHPAILIC